MSSERTIIELQVEVNKSIEKEIEPLAEVIGLVGEISMGKLRGQEVYKIMN